MAPSARQVIEGYCCQNCGAENDPRKTVNDVILELLERVDVLERVENASMFECKSGWGVVGKDGLDIRTVSSTRRAAIINWLVVAAEVMIYQQHTDDQIEALWSKHRGTAEVLPVRVQVMRDAGGGAK